MKDNLNWGKSMDVENLYGLMVQFLKESSDIIILKAKVFINGLMVESIKATGYNL